MSRVEMNPKNAPLTPGSLRRRLSARFLRSRAVKIALTKRTFSYTDITRFRRYFRLAGEPDVKLELDARIHCRIGALSDRKGRMRSDARAMCPIVGFSTGRRMDCASSRTRCSPYRTKSISLSPTFGGSGRFHRSRRDFKQGERGSRWPRCFFCIYAGRRERPIYAAIMD